jgi:hypothetical protein
MSRWYSAPVAGDPDPGKSIAATFAEEREGDCRMISGATWYIFPNGTASLEATVTSSDDDSWIIWRTELWGKDINGNHEVLDTIANVENPDPPTEFHQDMPDHTRYYRFAGRGTFDPAVYSRVAFIAMDCQC